MELTGIGVGSQAAVGNVFILRTSDEVFEHRKTTHTPDEEASILGTAIALSLPMPLNTTTWQRF